MKDKHLFSKIFSSLATLFSLPSLLFSKIFSSLATFLPLPLLLLTFIWVLLGAVIWPADNASHFREKFFLDAEKKRVLEIWGPQIVPGESASVEIHFTLRQEEAQPGCFQLTLPDGLVLLSETGAKLDRKVLLHFQGNEKSETLTLQIANANLFPGLYIHQETMLLEYLPQRKDPERKELARLPIGIEGTWRTVLGRYGGANDIPFAPLVALFTAAAGWAYQYTAQKREDIKEQQESAKRNLEQLKAALKSCQMDLAARTLERIHKQGLGEHLNEVDLYIGQQLIHLAAGKPISLVWDALPADWSEVSAQALIYASNAQRPEDIKRWAEQFPEQHLQDETLKKQLEQLKNADANVKFQARSWPPAAKSGTLPSLPQTTRAELRENPFPYESAREDEPFLFRANNQLFYAGHPLFEQLKSHSNALVVGEPGSGKTALALAIGKYGLWGARQFTCYVSGTPTLLEMQRALAKRLLEFLEELPAFIPGGDEQRRLLAEILLAAYPINFLTARLEHQAQKTDWPWLSQGTQDEQPNIWLLEARRRFQLLADSLRDAKTSLPPNWLWATSFRKCLQFLEFDEPAFLLVDAGEQFDERWYGGFLEHIDAWQEQNLYSIVFSSATRARLKRSLAGAVTQVKAAWNDEEMKKMAEHRWGNVCRERGFGTLFASTQAQDRLIHLAQGNPRRFIQLWNRVIADGLDNPISVEIIDKAAA